MQSNLRSSLSRRGMAMCLLATPLGLSAACGHSGVCTTAQVNPAKSRVLRHVVLFKFKSDVPAEQIREIENAFAALPGKIPAIIDFEWGTDVGVEDKANGFTHAFFVTFANEKARDHYLPHPEHQAFVALLRPRLDKVLVVDYWNRP